MRFLKSYLFVDIHCNKPQGREVDHSSFLGLSFESLWLDKMEDLDNHVGFFFSLLKNTLKKNVQNIRMTKVDVNFHERTLVHVLFVFRKMIWK